MPNDKSLFVWRVSCIHRQTREFFHRDMVLDQEAVPAEEMPQLMRMLTSGSPGGTSKQGVTKYRRYFKEAPGGIPINWDDYDHTEIFSLPHYFEDEEGNPLTTHGMMQAVTGRDDVMVLGDVESVLRIGPIDMANPEQWTVEKANILAHFLEVTDCLAVSEFMRSKSGYTLTTKVDGTSQITRFDRPNVLVVNSVLAFIRQLVARDDLFATAVEVYLAHCNDNGKRMWMNYCRSMVKKVLDDRPFGVQIEGFTGMNLLSLFNYAFGLLHHPRQDQIDEFRETVAKCGREKLTGAFHFTCVSIVSETYNAGLAIRQDFAHWLAKGCGKPERVGIIDLLGPISRR